VWAFLSAIAKIGAADDDDCGSNLDAPLGAEVSGVDLAKPLPQSDVDAIQTAWRTRLVVVIRGQALSDPELLALQPTLRRTRSARA